MIFSKRRGRRKVFPVTLGTIEIVYNQVFGTDGDDRNETAIYGTDGPDQIYDGPGRDEMYGGAGGDIFVLYDDNEKDEIRDFVHGEDKIDLSWVGAPDFDSLTIVQDGPHVRIVYINVVVEVRNDSVENFSPSDFLFTQSAAQIENGFGLNYGLKYGSAYGGSA